uniref:Uncharacterized protein n=1 Tax=Rhizophora mucronata TaxID=61149 RepID=A0A2P2NIC6_RHIMU
MSFPCHCPQHNILKIMASDLTLNLKPPEGYWRKGEMVGWGVVPSNFRV